MQAHLLPWYFAEQASQCPHLCLSLVSLLSCAAKIRPPVDHSETPTAFCQALGRKPSSAPVCAQDTAHRPWLWTSGPPQSVCPPRHLPPSSCSPAETSLSSPTRCLHFSEHHLSISASEHQLTWRPSSCGCSPSSLPPALPEGWVL